MTADTELLKVVNSSGFPLQIALQMAVESGCPKWRVQHKEHAWRNVADGTSGFIDFVVQHQDTRDSLVVECKRVQNCTWLFLGHSGSAAERRQCKAWVTTYDRATLKHFGWADIAIDPRTPEAQFCSLRGQSTNDKNTFLERVAGDLVSSTEALAVEERDYRSETQESIRLYFNVIVTTAELQFVEFDKSSLSLTDGSLSVAKFHKVPYVRVRKQFSMRPVLLTPEDWHRSDDPDRRRENTVFVVSAAHFTEFINALDVESTEVKRIGG